MAIKQMVFIAYAGCYSTVKSKNLYSVCQYEEYFAKRQNSGSFF